MVKKQNFHLSDSINHIIFLHIFKMGVASAQIYKKGKTNLNFIKTLKIYAS